MDTFSLLIFSLCLSLYYFLHSFLAHDKIKAILISKWIPLRYYRLIYNIIATVLLLAVVFHHWEGADSFHHYCLLYSDI